MLGRCSKCGREFKDSVFNRMKYGESPTARLCPDCLKIVEEALKGVEKRYEARKRLIPGGLLGEMMETIRLMRVDHDQSEESDQKVSFDATSMSFTYLLPIVLDDGYVYSCAAVIDGVKYYVESRSEKELFTDGTRVYELMEYDLIEDKFTEKPWIDQDDTDGKFTVHNVLNFSEFSISSNKGPDDPPLNIEFRDFSPFINIKPKP